MNKKLYYVGSPNLVNKKKFYGMVDEIWKNKRLSNDGPYVKEFEKQIEQFLNVPYAIVVNNATLGLQILAQAVLQGSEFITTSFTFVATVYALEWIGFKPIFADIDVNTHNLLPFNTFNSVVATHVWGRPCDIDLFNYNNSPLIFDAAHAFGCSYKGTKVGNFGDGEVFSFHATKFINSFEGGVITTRNEKTAELCRLYRNFGFVDYDDSQVIGINAKMNEIQAAMGLCSLDNYFKIVEHNKRNYELYQEYLYGIEGIKIIEYDPLTTPNYQYIVLELDKNRDDISKKLWEKNIFCRRYFYPGVHRMEPYKKQNIKLPNTEYICDRVLILPNGTSINSKDVKFICKSLKGSLDE